MLSERSPFALEKDSFSSPKKGIFFVQVILLLKKSGMIHLKNIAKQAVLGMLLMACLPGTAQSKKLNMVAANDCGVSGAQPFLVAGNDYTMPEGIRGSKEAVTCNFGSKVVYAFNRMDIHADYRLEVVFLSDQERQQRIVVDGNEIQPPTTLAAGKEQRYMIDLPRKAYAYGQLVLVFENTGKGPNAIVSELNLYSSNPKAPVPFAGDEKRALANVQTYKVDKDIDVEKVLPVYAPVPKSVPGSYQPKLSLNGGWMFCPCPDKDFYRKEAADGKWKPIVVPGEWAMQGFKVDSAAFAGYRKTFAVPDDWQGRQIRLRFDGVHSEYRVYLNGTEVGSHLGGMTPYEIDITRHVKRGSNTLALAVRSESMADMLGSLTQYAAHQLGGITRKVTLFAVPKTYVADLRITTGLDKDYRDALLSLQTFITNATDRVQDRLSLRLSIDGLPNVAEKKLPRLAVGETWKGIVSDSVVAPELWDNEHPRLYTLRVELCNGGEIVETIEKRFGFREIKIRGNELLVNGKPVKLRGVCRHEMDPLAGRVVAPELERRDVELYRAANCNFIRTSHYPPCEEMLDVCDELGMFVEVESPVCWVGHHANENWQTLNYQDRKYYPYILQANMENIHFNRNHPSVLFWSMANESYWNREFAQVQEYVAKADPTRPHTFHDQAYGGFNNQGSTAPIANIHYPGPGGYKVAAKSDRPMTYGEFCHLNVYNRSELVTDPGIRSDWALALAPTWENMYKTKGVLGGSIWSGIDDIFQMPDGNAVGYGPWGPIDGWRRPKPEYWDMKKIYSPVRVLTKGLDPSHRLTVRLENRYTFTDMNELKIAYKYGSEQGILSASIPPSGQGEISIDIRQPEQANELYLSFVDPRGFVADEYLIPVGKQVQNELPDMAELPTKLKTQKDRFVISGKNFVCEISRTSGQIVSLRTEGKEKLCGGPWLMALPLTGGGCYPNHNANTPVFNDLCSEWTVDKVEARCEGQNVRVSVEGRYKEFEGSYTLVVNSNGEMVADYRFKALQDVNPRQWGLVFDAPRSYDQTFWRRSGMWSVYPYDHISRPAGSASLFYKGLPDKVNPRIRPSWPWSMDFNELGSNDFRATRRNIWYAGLKDGSGNTITVRSDGKQHWRSWLDKGKIHFLVADFVTAGNEMFLDGYYAPYRKPLKQGDEIYGKVCLRM